MWKSEIVEILYKYVVRCAAKPILQHIWQWQGLYLLNKEPGFELAANEWKSEIYPCCMDTAPFDDLLSGSVSCKQVSLMGVLSPEYTLLS